MKMRMWQQLCKGLEEKKKKKNIRDKRSSKKKKREEHFYELTVVERGRLFQTFFLKKIDNLLYNNNFSPSKEN